ncbi:hypothetical protein LR48_Vigan04g191100 [Vigna angularis]|uniref:Uncharacterized protein n=1 Tax=Phaseolus angularis TaxID=3914 RepID=A0A0L9UG39_PHAAN|nr:hypothetical protein LR48_Vigan04g191100 [Vigna angularis]
MVEGMERSSRTVEGGEELEPNGRRQGASNGRRQGEASRMVEGGERSSRTVEGGERSSRTVEGMERSGGTVEGGEELEPSGRMQGKQSRTGAEPDRLKSDYPNWDNRLPESNVKGLPKPNGSRLLDPNVRERAEPKERGLTEPNGKGLLEPNGSGLTDSNTKGLPEPNGSRLLDPNVRERAEPKDRGLTEPNGKGLLELNGSGLTDSNVRGQPEPNVRKLPEPNGLVLEGRMKALEGRADGRINGLERTMDSVRRWASKKNRGFAVFDTPAEGRKPHEVLKDIKDQFLRAYDSGKVVTRMLDEEWKTLEEVLPPPKPPDLNWRATASEYPSYDNTMMKRSQEIKFHISNLEDKGVLLQGVMLRPNGSRMVEGMERSSRTVEGGEELEPNGRRQGASNGRRQGEVSRTVEDMERSGGTVEGGEELEPSSRVQGKQSRTGAGLDRLESDYPNWDKS